jgi:peptidoglycan hydrolase-like protein with peptidoglycan-binding domain
MDCRQCIKDVTLRNKGYYRGQIDGLIGPRTRAGIRHTRSLRGRVTGCFDTETAGKLGMGSESVSGSFKDAGQEVGKGGVEMSQAMKQGKPIAEGKELGKRTGRAGNKVGEAVKKAASADSDRGDREKK